MVIISYCPTCGYEEWGIKPVIKICCGFYIEHKEVEG
jgi:hypothetical protein